MANKIKEQIELSAVVKYDKPYVPQIVDKKISGQQFVGWGEKNDLPNFLWDAYLNNTVEQAAVNSTVDYIIGDEIKHNFLFYPEKFEDTIRDIIMDYVLFGGFALEGIRNAKGEIVQLNWQNIMNLRVNETMDTAYLSSKWGSYTGKDIITLPIYKENEKQPHFIFYYNGQITRGINPIPIYIGGLKSIETLNRAKNFHLRNIENGFSASAIISLNNGNLKGRELDEIKQKLEKNYCGDDNAGKFVLINNPDKDHAVTIERLNADNFGDLYNTLSVSSTEDIYTAFRLNPMLVGRNVQTGFSKEEFEQCYKLYYSTVIRPLQNNIIKELKKLGIDVEFGEFKINW